MFFSVSKNNTSMLDTLYFYCEYDLFYFKSKFLVDSKKKFYYISKCKYGQQK